MSLSELANSVKYFISFRSSLPMVNTIVVLSLLDVDETPVSVNIVVSFNSELLVERSVNCVALRVPASTVSLNVRMILPRFMSRSNEIKTGSIRSGVKNVTAKELLPSTLGIISFSFISITKPDE